MPIPRTLTRGTGKPSRRQSPWAARPSARQGPSAHSGTSFPRSEPAADQDQRAAIGSGRSRCRNAGGCRLPRRLGSTSSLRSRRLRDIEDNRDRGGFWRTKRPMDGRTRRRDEALNPERPSSQCLRRPRSHHRRSFCAAVLFRPTLGAPNATCWCFRGCFRAKNSKIHDFFACGAPRCNVALAKYTASLCQLKGRGTSPKTKCFNSHRRVGRLHICRRAPCRGRKNKVVHDFFFGISCLHATTAGPLSIEVLYLRCAGSISVQKQKNTKQLMQYGVATASDPRRTFIQARGRCFPLSRCGRRECSTRRGRSPSAADGGSWKPASELRLV